MKFSVSSSALLSLLATTGKVISNKNTLPILDYFLMELSGNELKVTTSDLETTLIGSITVDSVESEGTIAAPAKLMLDSLKEFSELPLTIDVNDKNWEITINWKSGSLSIPGASAVSYPAVPQLSAEKKELSMDVDTLVNGINKTIFATADDELRPVMNGIYINLAPGALTFVGTDAHKLVKYESETANEVTASFILPKKPANLLKSVLLNQAVHSWRPPDQRPYSSDGIPASLDSWPERTGLCPEGHCRRETPPSSCAGICIRRNAAYRYPCPYSSHIRFQY